ncbi:hypothetical protein FCH28_16205 [Streptomyces piniterrae]|uniref:Uncharacterized protein n=1 Tax=Streptomyces piniterrae TaxID=2571125 RepID=A0A4U0NK10_9ACTN|nr:hypothetical protein [Streptomyces piniterrae]TJZ54626.1 hypothetical protein FCH28_16205 [Streptomyces piniterrae]
MEPDPDPETGSDRRRISIVQLICHAYGLSDVSEITVEHIHRYVTERRLADARTSQLQGRRRPRIPRQRASGGTA